jgi:hypothetical protein
VVVKRLQLMVVGICIILLGGCAGPKIIPIQMARTTQTESFEQTFEFLLNRPSNSSRLRPGITAEPCAILTTRMQSIVSWTTFLTAC